MRYGQHPNESWGSNWRQLHEEFVANALSGKLKICPYCNHPIKIEEENHDRKTGKQGIATV